MFRHTVNTGRYEVKMAVNGTFWVHSYMPDNPPPPLPQISPLKASNISDRPRGYISAGFYGRYFHMPFVLQCEEFECWFCYLDLAAVDYVKNQVALVMLSLKV
jgi:hypothetical protein